MSFAHLHCHTHYSLLDGASKIPQLVSRAKELGMDSLAITDHGNLHGALKFYQECRRQGVNPIIGYEAYVVGDPASRDDSNYHLTILARDRQGYSNLLRLASTAYLEGFYRKPRISKSSLCAAGDGLTVLSGCMSSEFARSLDDFEVAWNAIAELVERFGENFFIEIQRNGMPAQDSITAATIDFATRRGLPMVATADCHYVRKEDADSQDILLCVNTGSKRSQQDRMRMDGRQYYLRSPEEMYDEFRDQEEAVRNAGAIAESVDIELDLGVRHFPVFQTRGESPADALRRIASEGLAARLGEAGPAYQARLDQELKVIHDLGFDEYFLIIEDFTRWARERGILSSARGSGVGSLVCYCLYLSHVDPIEHGLLFERFLSYSRREAPDIDMDFEKERRAEVMWYVKQKYGEDCVAQIGTFGTMGPKSAIKDVARALGFPLDDTNRLTSLVPDDPFHELQDTFKTSPEFAQIYEDDLDARAVIDYALQLEGTARSLGTHAAAVVISDRPLVEYVPLAKVAGKTEVITQWDMHDVETAGLMKMDFLGLRNMSILSEVVRIIEKNHGLRIDIHKIPFDDRKTFELLQRGETKGIFQLESVGMTGVLVSLVPDCLSDINACIALYRPGPLDAGMIQSFTRRKHGQEPVTYPHDCVAESLRETYGIMVYQEQVMQIAHLLGGIPLDEAYSFVKAISKKIPEKVAAYRERFVAGCEKHGVAGDKLWGQIETFARYGFNKSHSTAYAFIAYQTAWFKAHYPIEFMCALLNADIGDRNFKRKDKLVEHLEDCRRMGICVEQPDINLGGDRFRVRGSKIIFGLSAIKGVGAAHATAIEKNRGATPYSDIADFCRRNTKQECPAATLRNLIRVGACDKHWPEDRRKNELAIPKAQKLAAGGYKNPDRVKLYESKKVVEGKELDLEHELLGYYRSGHPADTIGAEINEHSTIWPTTFNSVDPETFVVGGGMVSGMRRGYTKTSEKPFASFSLETSEGVIDCVMWSTEAVKYKWVKHGMLIFVEGRLDQRGKVDSGRSGGDVKFDAGQDGRSGYKHGGYRSITVKRVVLPDKIDWTVSYRVDTISVERLFEIVGHFPGDRPMHWFKDGQEARLRTMVKPCKELVDQLRAAGATVKVCYDPR